MNPRNPQSPSYGIAWRHSESFVRAQIHGRPLPNQFIALLRRIEAESLCADRKSLLLDLQAMERPLGLAERQLLVQEVVSGLWHLERVALLLPAVQPAWATLESRKTESGGCLRIFSCEGDALDWLLGLVFAPAV